MPRLRDQRAEKMRKDELALQCRMKKSSSDHADTMFLYERHVQGNCWTTVEQVEVELSKIKGITAQRNTLKDQITTHVKGLKWKEHHTPWSFQGKLHSVDYLKEHLLHIITDSTRRNKTIESPSMSLPKLK